MGQVVRIRTDGLFRYIPEGRAPDEGDRRHLLRDHVRYQPEALQGIGPQPFRIIDDDRALPVWSPPTSNVPTNISTSSGRNVASGLRRS